MSNSNSSREVTEKKKKKNVWEEAGEEFYQESYPSGSGGQVDGNVIVPKSNRPNNFPLPSHTARKNSFGYHNRRRSTFGRTATVTTNTNAFTTYNSTTRLPAHEVNVAALPDFAEMTIPNERKRWLELHRIKSMPINMGAKKELKTQLTTIPMLKLKGTKRLKWNIQRLKDNLILKWQRWKRRHFLWNKALMDVEEHAGPFITRILISIKWTVYFNFLLFLLLLIFIIFPKTILPEDRLQSNSTCLPSSPEEIFDGNISISLTSQISKKDLAVCCTEDYRTEIGKSRCELEDSDWTLLLRALNMSTEGWGFPLALTYGFYSSAKLKLPTIFNSSYDLPLTYILFPILFFSVSLITVLFQIRAAIKEVALAREGEFYKFSNLVFAGWDHYTKTLAGANFKKRILKHEMRTALETEHFKVASESPKQKWLTILKRCFTNVFVLIVLGGVGTINFVIADLSLRTQGCLGSNCTEEETQFVSTRNPGNIMIQILPAVSIALCNFFILSILHQIGRSEGHSHETAKALLLTRGLIGRLLAVGSVAASYYRALYCPKSETSCRSCRDESTEEKDPCWEAAFGIQILIILIVDLIFRVVLTMVFGYGRFLIGKILPCKAMGDQNFCTTRHSLDVLYIQALSAFFYFSPFLPLAILISSLLMFYVKKFSIMTIAKGVAETVRTTRSKAVYVTVRLLALVTVAISLGFVLFEMEPSKGCGPFRTNSVPWDVVTDLDHRSATEAVMLLLSPRILIPLLLIITIVSYFYYSSAKANRRMVETLK